MHRCFLEHGVRSAHPGKLVQSTPPHVIQTDYRKAHTHARNAVLETRKSNPVAASEEHDLAAGEFAAAALNNPDQEVSYLSAPGLNFKADHIVCNLGSPHSATTRKSPQEAGRNSEIPA
jgi:hypothetical protein